MHLNSPRIAPRHLRLPVQRQLENFALRGNDQPLKRHDGRRTYVRAAPSTFAFSARTHAILLIVSGSFVPKTSSSCGPVVPMREPPRPGRAVPLALLAA